GRSRRGRELGAAIGHLFWGRHVMKLAWMWRNCALGAVIGVVGMGVVARQSMAAEPKAESKTVETVDLNTAASDELEQLPGVGPAYAKKIIAGRPYKSVDDLAKAGLPSNVVFKIKPLVGVGVASTAATTTTGPQPRVVGKPVTPDSSAAPAKGSVWVNLDSK